MNGRPEITGFPGSLPSPVSGPPRSVYIYVDDPGSFAETDFPAEMRFSGMLKSGLTGEEPNPLAPPKAAKELNSSSPAAAKTFARSLRGKLLDFR